MTLTELKDYVQARRIVSELEIATHFRVEPSVIEPMARRWIDKGLMAKVDLYGLRGWYQTSLRMAGSTVRDFREEVIIRLWFTNSSSLTV